METDRRSRGAFGVMLAASIFVGVGCSDDSSTDGDTSLDESQKLSTLTDSQLGALCDWSNAQQGGYGKSTQCGAGVTLSTQKDQAACKAEDGPALMKCDQTVGTYKACTVKLAAGNPCDISGVLASKECQPLLPCLTGG